MPLKVGEIIKLIEDGAGACIQSVVATVSSSTLIVVVA